MLKYQGFRSKNTATRMNGKSAYEPRIDKTVQTSGWHWKNRKIVVHVPPFQFPDSYADDLWRRICVRYLRSTHHGVLVHAIIWYSCTPARHHVIRRSNICIDAFTLPRIDHPAHKKNRGANEAHILGNARSLLAPTNLHINNNVYARPINCSEPRF